MLAIERGLILHTTHHLTAASPSVQGYRLFRATPGDPTPEMQTLADFAKTFEGNEFRILPRPEDALAPEWQGHRLIRLLNGEFRVISTEELASLPQLGVKPIGGRDQPVTDVYVWQKTTLKTAACGRKQRLKSLRNGPLSSDQCGGVEDQSHGLTRD